MVDTFLLSCRALGRGVEHRMVAQLGEIASERGAGVCGDSFRRIAAQSSGELVPGIDRAGKRQCVSIVCARGCGVRYRPRRRRKLRLRRSDSSAQSLPRIDYVRIATELRDPAQVLERIRAASRKAAPARPIAAPPRTPLERELAELWAAC